MKRTCLNLVKPSKIIWSKYKFTMAMKNPFKQYFLSIFFCFCVVQSQTLNCIFWRSSLECFRRYILHVNFFPFQFIHTAHTSYTQKCWKKLNKTHPNINSTSCYNEKKNKNTKTDRSTKWKFQLAKYVALLLDIEWICNYFFSLDKF